MTSNSAIDRLSHAPADPLDAFYERTILNSSRDAPGFPDDPYFPTTRYTEFDQDWRSVKAELSTPITLICAPAPWTLLFDFNMLDGSDLVQIAIEAELVMPNGRRRWTLTDQHEVTIDQSAGPRRQLLQVDGESISHGKLLTISPMSGPWPARLIYRHERTLTKLVRYMLLDTAKYPQ